jgi:hypothetical protein
MVRCSSFGPALAKEIPLDGDATAAAGVGGHHGRLLLHDATHDNTPHLHAGPKEDVS